VGADPRDAVVTLREVTAGTVRSIVALDVAPGQRGLVAPNAVSIAQAYFEPAAWFRAIHADDTPVGFVMLYDPTRTPAPEAGRDVALLWRFMIDHRHQGRGHGRAALGQVIEHVRTLPGVTRLRTSYVDAQGNASPLYLRAGFRATGEIDDGEVVMELRLRESPFG
jgi:diamine N-acetyltransferase